MYYLNRHGEYVGQFCEKCKRPIFYKLDKTKMEDNKLVHENCKEE